MAEVTPKKIYVQNVAFDNIYPTSGTTIPHLTKVYAEFNSVDPADHWVPTTLVKGIKSIKGVELYSVDNTQSGTMPTWLNNAGGTCHLTITGNSPSAVKVMLLCSDKVNDDN